MFGCCNWLLKDLWPNFTSWVQTVTPSLITVLTHVTEVSKSYRRVKILLVSAVQHKPNSVMKGIYWLLRESPKVCRLQAQTKQPSQDVAHCHCQPYSYLPFFSQARQWLITATRVEVSRKRKKTKTMTTTTKPRSLGRWKIPSSLFLPIQPSTISSHGQDLGKKSPRKPQSSSPTQNG